MSTQIAVPASSISTRNITTPLGPVGRYRMKYTLLLTCVPLVCGIVLLMLLSVFSKLNLYYLESNGLIIDDQIRDAYFSQVQTEIVGAAGILFLQLIVTAVVSIIVMRWAGAPFSSAVTTLDTALNAPDSLRPNSRLLSESHYFDRLIWIFALRVKNGGQVQTREAAPKTLTNLLFLAKFTISFAILSVVTGFCMGMVISSVYDKITNLAITLVKVSNLQQAQHFFAAQLDVLRDATDITTGVSIFVYLIIGIQISRYMTTMIFVFARAIEEDRFPVQLRIDDVYHGLANVMNRAREKIR